MKKTKSRGLKKDKSSPAMLIPLYIFTIIFVFLPIVYVFSLAFVKRDGNIGVIWEFTLNNFKKINDPVYLQTFYDSFKLAITTTILTVLIGYPFGYLMAKQNEKWRKILSMAITVPFWTNSLVRIYGWMILMRNKGLINGILLKTGIIDEPIKMLYTYGAVLVGMIYGLLPFMILSVYSSVEKMDWTLVEAARDLGATSRRAFFTVTLPQTMPGLVSGAVLVFVPSMGLFFISDLLGGGRIMLLGNLIQSQFMGTRDWPFGAALSLVMIVLVGLIVWLFRKVTKTDKVEVKA